MQKTDKLFAALVVLSLAAFWVVIAPASFTAKVSDAAPASLTPEPTVAETKRTEPVAPTRETRKQRTEKPLSAEKLARLKERSKDTPMTAEEMRMRGIPHIAPNQTPNATGPAQLMPRPTYKQVY